MEEMSDNKIPMESRVIKLVSNSEEEYGLFGQRTYNIPIYQRPYSWKEEQIEQFLNSMKSCYELQNEYVFMGTVQFMELMDNKEKTIYKNGLPVFDIIDGQQRITTFILFFKLLGLIAERDIIKEYDIKMEIDNSDKRNDLLKKALSYELKLIPEYDGSKSNKKSFAEITENNIYLRNLSLLCYFYKEVFAEYDKDDKDYIWTKEFATNLIQKIKEHIYFVELDTKGLPLPQVVNIFNTINTTGLELNSTDLFKLNYYEYLKKDFENNDEWMKKITDCYNALEAENYKMDEVLDIYKHCIVGKYDLKWDKLSYGNEKFFAELFNNKFDNIEQDREILEFDEFDNIVNLYINFNKFLAKDEKNIGTLELLAVELIESTRYGRYYTIPYVAAYFISKIETNIVEVYKKSLRIGIEVYKLLAVNSVNFLKVINPVQSYISSDVLNGIANIHCNEDIEKLIANVQEKINCSPYDDSHRMSKEWFIGNISGNLFDNGKSTYVTCVLSGVLYEIGTKKPSSANAIRNHFFNWAKNPFDLEHIYAQNNFKDRTYDEKALFNSIGNIITLERSINRKIKDDEVIEKINEYKNSEFLEVKKICNELKNGKWDIPEVTKRKDNQVKLLCDFLFSK